jgi:hypothetical protein
MAPPLIAILATDAVTVETSGRREVKSLLHKEG